MNIVSLYIIFFMERCYKDRFRGYCYKKFNLNCLFSLLQYFLKNGIDYLSSEEHVFKILYDARTCIQNIST